MTTLIVGGFVESASYKLIIYCNVDRVVVLEPIQNYDPDQRDSFPHLSQRTRTPRDVVMMDSYTVSADPNSHIFALAYLLVMPLCLN